MNSNLNLDSHFKVAIHIHHELRYIFALAFVNTVEPTARGGLATAYRTRAGVALMTLNEVVDAAIAGDLAR